MAKLKQSYL